MGEEGGVVKAGWGCLPATGEGGEGLRGEATHWGQYRRRGVMNGKVRVTTKTKLGHGASCRQWGVCQHAIE